MRLKLLIISLLLLKSGLSYASPMQLKRPGILGVCSYSEFKPITYGKNKDAGAGFEADLLKAVAKKWNLKIKFYPEKFYDGLWRTPSQQYTLCDVAIGGFTPTAARVKEGAVFSKITVFFKQSLLIRKQDFEQKKIVSYDSFKDVKGLKIGVVPGTTGEKYALMRAREQNIPLTVFKQYTSESELLPALKAGEIDAIARGEIGNDYQAELDNGLMVIERKGFSEGFAIAANAADEKGLHYLCEEIDRITDNGQIGYKEWTKDKNTFIKRLKK